VSFDTKYRPLSYGDVLGQQATIDLLKEYVRSGKGFHQSYLFAGAHGSGKTTLGRLLARALLCESPKDGEPCDECSSCKALLEYGTSDSFTELDAANNSGKGDMKKIIEELSYSTFTGNRRLYLFDEAHRLSTQAYDALLKHLEDTDPATGETHLVCIFCTTEPERVKDTIKSRCASTFVIEMQTPETIAGRLEHICKEEELEFDPEVLPLLGELKECHVRDAIKALEGVSMMGEINQENVERYLHLDLHRLYLDVLTKLGDDLQGSLEDVRELLKRVSPTTIYERLAHLCVLAYKVKLGIATPPSYWDSESVTELGNRYDKMLLKFAETFAQKPGRPVPSVLECDLIHLHFMANGVALVTTPSDAATAFVPPPAPVPQKTQEEDSSPEKTEDTPSQVAELSKKTVPLPKKEVDENPSNVAILTQDDEVTANGVYVVGRAKSRGGDQTAATGSTSGPSQLDGPTFCHLLALRVSELSEGRKRGSSG